MHEIRWWRAIIAATYPLQAISCFNGALFLWLTIDNVLRTNSDAVIPLCVAGGWASYAVFRHATQVRARAGRRLEEARSDLR